jgi:hypothetical protein
LLIGRGQLKRAMEAEGLLSKVIIPGDGETIVF